jgi:hypothetical protein
LLNLLQQQNHELFGSSRELPSAKNIATTNEIMIQNLSTGANEAK